MYKELLENPESRKKLEELRVLKHRKVLLPSETDMRILGEASALSHSFKVYFITDDRDYIEFKDKIQEKLNVNVVEMLDLNRFRQIFDANH